MIMGGSVYALMIHDFLAAKKCQFQNHPPKKPIASMYGIFTYIHHKFIPKVGKYSSPMDGMGTFLFANRFFGWKGRRHVNSINFEGPMQRMTKKQGLEPRKMGEESAPGSKEFP